MESPKKCVQRPGLKTGDLGSFRPENLTPYPPPTRIYDFLYPHCIYSRWTCDCRLRSFRLWLTQSNVPRMVEPSCHGPRRLLGIHIQSLSLAEFACAPQLSPTSMYLTVPKGKNVSIVCRVASDPVSTITWFFNGRQIHTSDHEESVSG